MRFDQPIMAIAQPNVYENMLIETSATEILDGSIFLFSEFLKETGVFTRTQI